MKISVIKIFLAAIIICNLAACGKMSAPSPYEGSGYPHTYPKY